MCLFEIGKRSGTNRYVLPLDRSDNRETDLRARLWDLSSPSTSSSDISTLLPRASASLPSTPQPLRSSPRATTSLPHSSSSLTSISSRKSPPPKRGHRPNSSKSKVELITLSTRQKQQLTQIKRLAGKNFSNVEKKNMLSQVSRKVQQGSSAGKCNRKWWAKFSPKSALARETEGYWRLETKFYATRFLKFTFFKWVWGASLISSAW